MKNSNDQDSMSSTAPGFYIIAACA